MKTAPKYKRGDAVLICDKPYKLGRCEWNKEFQEYEYYAYPILAPVFERDIFRPVGDSVAGKNHGA